MRQAVTKFMPLILLLVVLASSIQALEPGTPDQTFLWNRFDHLVAIDQFVVGCSQRGFVVSKYNSDKRLYYEVNQLLEELNPQRIKLFGDVLIVKENEGRLTFVDMSQLPEIRLLGHVDLGSDFADFAMIENDLVVSKWFDGLTRYRLTDYSTASFADSSLKGVLVTQIEVEDDTLYALDEYNGILRYDVTSQSRMNFIDYLWVPHRPSSFIKFGANFSVSLKNDGLMFGRFDLPGSIYDSLMDLSPARSLYQTDRMIVQVTDRSLVLISKDDFTVSDTITIEQVSTFGDIITLDNRPWLTLPSTNGGFKLFDLEGGARPVQGYARPGPITDILLYRNQIVSGGEANPLDVYQVDNIKAPYLDTTINPEMAIISGFERTNDSLIVFYSHGINSLVLYSGLADPDYPLFLELRYPTDSLGFSRLYLSDPSFGDSLRFILIAKEHFFEAYTVSNSGNMQYIGRWSYIGRIETFAIDGRNLYVITSKGTLWVHLINEDLTRSLLTSVSVFRNTSEMFVRFGKLWIIQDKVVTWLDITNPEEPTVETVFNLDLAVSDISFFGDSMYTVGYEGVGIYNMREQRPKLVWSNDWPGVMIDVDSDMIAVSDGSAIDLFRHPSWSEGTPEPVPQLPGLFVLKANYPNPFNAATTINFDLAVTAHIELNVYNGLGRKVAKLASGIYMMGSHEVKWDGRDRDGKSVASGVYFYQLRVCGEQDSRKMIYLK